MTPAPTPVVRLCARTSCASCPTSATTLHPACARDIGCVIVIVLLFFSYLADAFPAHVGSLKLILVLILIFPREICLAVCCSLFSRSGNPATRPPVSLTLIATGYPPLTQHAPIKAQCAACACRSCRCLFGPRSLPYMVT